MWKDYTVIVIQIYFSITTHKLRWEVLEVDWPKDGAYPTLERPR